MYRIDRVFPCIGARREMAYCNLAHHAEEICGAMELRGVKCEFCYVGARKCDHFDDDHCRDYPHFTLR